MTNTTTPETGISRGTRPTGKKRTGRVVAITGTAALALAGITAAVFMGFAAPASAPGAAAAPTTITKISKQNTTTDSGSSGGGKHSGGHSSHPTGTPTQQEILRWQTDLSKLNYYDGPLDGVMSAETHNSIRLLQADADLTETGDMNAATRTAMQYMLDHQTDHHSTNGGGTHTSGNNSGGGTSGGNSHHATTPPSQQILHWQKDLTTLSYYDGNLDGVMSPEMQQSIRLLQGDAGLPQTGTMDTPTQAAMQKMLHSQS